MHQVVALQRLEAVAPVAHGLVAHPAEEVHVAEQATDVLTALVRHGLVAQRPVQLLHAQVTAQLVHLQHEVVAVRGAAHPSWHCWCADGAEPPRSPDPPSFTALSTASHKGAPETPPYHSVH